MQARILAIFAVAIVVSALGGILLLSDVPETPRNAPPGNGADRPTDPEATRRREATQAFVAQAVAASAIPAALEVLEEFRGDLAAAAAGAAAIPRQADVARTAESRRRFVADFLRGGLPLVDTVVEALADRIHDRIGDAGHGTGGRDAFVAAERQRLVTCLAVSLPQCFWDYSFVTLMETLSATTRAWQVPLSARVLLTDANGVGLADSDHPRWSDDVEFAARLDLARQARNARLPRRDRITLGNVEWVATAFPLNGTLGQVVGTVIVADPVDAPAPAAVAPPPATDPVGAGPRHVAFLALVLVVLLAGGLAVTRVVQREGRDLDAQATARFLAAMQDALPWDDWQMADGTWPAPAGAPDADAPRPVVDAAALLREAPDVYYPRIYAEFLQARRSLGLPVEGITREGFLLRLARLEEKMQQRLGCEVVRFVVLSRAGDVVLVPVKVR